MVQLSCKDWDHIHNPLCPFLFIYYTTTHRRVCPTVFTSPSLPSIPTTASVAHQTPEWVVCLWRQGPRLASDFV